MAGNGREFRRIDGRPAAARNGRLLRWRDPPDQVERRLQCIRQRRGRPAPVNVHVEDARLFPQEMIVESRHFDSMVEQRRHHWIHFFLEQNQVAHEDFFPSRVLFHRHPSPKTKRCRRCRSGNRDLQIRPRNIRLQHAVLEVPFAAQRIQHFLVFGGHFLGGGWRLETTRTEHYPGERDRQDAMS